MGISNENNLIKHEGKTDLTQVANEAYKDGGKDFVKQLGQAGATFVGFYNNTIGALLELYNAWARPAINKTKEDIERRMLDIPQEKLCTPKINVLGPALEGLKYNLNEKDLKKMFENLIVNSCNSDYSDTIHPKFAEIIKQLSSDDAILLKALSQNITKAYAIVNVINKNQNGFKIIFPNLYICDFIDVKKIPAILDNLQTLGLIEISYENFLTDDSLYLPIIESSFYKQFYEQSSEISYQKGMFHLTILGRNFINVCI